MEFHPASNIFPMMSSEEFDSLVADIEVNGQLEPIYTSEGKIIDGRNRWMACEKLGVKPKTREWKGSGSLVAFVVSLNLKRRHLTSSQKAAVSVEALPLLEAEAKERMAAGGESAGRGRPKQGTEKIPYPNADHSGEAREHAAQIFGTNPRYVSDAKSLKESSPDLFAKVLTGDLTIPDAVRETRRNAVIERIEAVAASEPTAPVGKFDVIVLDPPWPIKKIERDVRPNQVELDYPVMSLDEIKSLQIISDHAASNSHIFMWTTQKFLPDSFDVFDAWGVRYVFMMVWHKPGGFQPIGLAQYNAEFCLYGRIGSPEFIDTKAFPTCFEAPRGEHSEKPQAFYELLNRVTAGRRLDVFNRRKITGFIGYGQEAA